MVGKSAVDAKAIASVKENNATTTNNESTKVSALACQLSETAIRLPPEMQEPIVMV